MHRRTRYINMNHKHLKVRLIAWSSILALAFSSVSCMTTYDPNGRAVQSVDPGVALAGVAAAGLIGYAASNNRRDKNRRNNYRRDIYRSDHYNHYPRRGNHYSNQYGHHNNGYSY